MRSPHLPLVGVLVALTGPHAGCVAPPLGFGSSPRIAAGPGRSSLEGRTAVAVGPGRQTYQAELSGTFRVRRWFAIESGVAITRVQQDQDDGDGDVALTGAFPFLRPRFFIDRVSLAIGLSGFGLGGGGGGCGGGDPDAQLGYGTEAWSLYAGAQRHYFELVAEDPIVASTRQLRLGGQYTWLAGKSRLGLALEVYRHDDQLRNGNARSDARFFAAGVKLSISSPELR